MSSQVAAIKKSAKEQLLADKEAASMEATLTTEPINFDKPIEIVAVDTESAVETEEMMFMEDVLVSMMAELLLVTEELHCCGRL